MGVGEILDASVWLYRKNFRLLIGAQLPMTLFSLITTAVTVYVVKAAPSNLLNMITQSVIEGSSDILEVVLKTSVPALSLVFGAVAVGILFPLVESARVLVYFQLRIKKEGFDLTQKMKQLSPSPG
jgi:hypothetical protein